MKDYYQILGVPKNASLDEVKRGYRKLAHEHHPDKGGQSERFKEINEAYQVLSDPAKRSQYDQFGTTFEGAGSTGPGFSGFGDQGFDFGGFGGGLGDIFEQFFGSAFATIQTQIEISIPQAVLGDTIHFQTHPPAGGGESLTLTIPPGTQDNTTFRLPGRGLPHQIRTWRGTQTRQGDLLVTVKIKIPQRLSREERELYERLKNLS